jgi:fluoride ion exporter CrcB/FEX
MSALTTLLMSFLTLAFNVLPALLLLFLAVRALQRTRDPAVPMSPADRRWRQAALALMWLLVAGFGFCGGFGTFAGLSSFFGASSTEARAYAQMFLVLGVCGLLVAGAGLWVIRRYRRTEAAGPHA